MKNIRLFLSISVLLFLMLGYGASQWAVYQNNAQNYAQKIDRPPVQWLALALLIASVVLAFIRDKEADET